MFKFFINYLSKYFFLVAIAAFFYFIMYLNYNLTLNSFKFVNSNKNEIDRFSIQYFKEDFEHKLSRKDFKLLYSDINYLIQLNQIDNKSKKSIGYQFIKARKNNKYTKYMENFENGSYYLIIDKLKKRMQLIDNYYLHPYNNTMNLYIHINIPSKSINIISKNDFYSLDLNNYISFESAGSNIKVKKKEIITQYNRSLNNLLNISKIFQEDAKKLFKDSFNNFIGFNIIFFLIMFTIIIATSFLYFKSKEERYKELENDESIMLIKKNGMLSKEARLNQIEHLMQHDIKTNIDERLNYLSAIYEQIKENLNETTLHSFLSMYTLDLTIKLANDYLKKDVLSVPHFYEIFKTENIFKFANKELETYGDIGNNILKNIIIFDIDKDLDKINDFSVKNIFQNEFSALLFRLINNALKHSSDKKVKVYIGKDKYNYLKICITNNVRNIKKAKYEIETSLQAEDDVKNVIIVQRSIKKFNMFLDYEFNNNNSTIIANIIKET